MAADRVEPVVCLEDASRKRRRDREELLDADECELDFIDLSVDDGEVVESARTGERAPQREPAWQARATSRWVQAPPRTALRMARSLTPLQWQTITRSPLSNDLIIEVMKMMFKVIFNKYGRNLALVIIFILFTNS